MSLDEARPEAQRLAEQLRHHSFLYHIEARPEITDDEYDSIDDLFEHEDDIDSDGSSAIVAALAAHTRLGSGGTGVLPYAPT